MRVVAVFEKNERIRHIGHLDIQRAVQRGLRRSGLPVAYSKGFNPHILITFASALSTGAWGNREIMDVTMEQEVSTEQFIHDLNTAMPPEMQVSSARIVDDRHPAMMAMLTAASYEIEICDPEAAEKLCAGVPELLQRNEVQAIRKTKSGLKECDIRPLIYDLTVVDGKLQCTMKLTEREACKPNMLISALASQAGMEEEPRTLVKRIQLWGDQPDGTRTPLETM